MPPIKHAVLSASSAARWINCPPSARLSEKYEDQSSEYVREGTDAHALCEYYLNKMLGRDAEDPIPNLSYYNTEMDNCANNYTSYIAEIVEEAKQTCRDPIVLVEQKIDFSRYAPEGFGTADTLIISDGKMYVCDFKYGTGVPVSAEDNPQLKLYALGAIALFDGIYEVNNVELVIYQPRLSNISTFEISTKELLDWAENVLKPAAKLAFDGAGNFKFGPWCKFCKARINCRERARFNLELARFYFAPPPNITDEELAEILPRLDDFVSWAEDVKKYAYESALKGKKWPGFKLVEGRSVRKFTDEEAVAKIIIDAGYDPYERKLIGMTELNKTLGKAKFNQLLGEYITKPKGKATLVPESDKREEISKINEFLEEN